jgi:2',3'-cyclic-nucleotide 2'-phosphodiesterase (5'-nucleotidase family)
MTVNEAAGTIGNAGQISGPKPPPDLRLLHYNDVYHIEYAPSPAKRMGGITNHAFRSGSAEPVGGVARFQTIVKEYRVSPCYADQPSLLTLFSGDAFNPSLESSVTKGRHMVPFLNAVGTDLACVGVRMAPFTLFPASIY